MRKPSRNAGASSNTDANRNTAANRKTGYSRTAGYVVFTALGVGLLLLSSALAWFAGFGQRDTMLAYTGLVQDLAPEKNAAALAAAEQYNARLAAKQIDLDHDSEYESLLQVPFSDALGYLKIPRINVDLPILHGAGESSLSRGIGHLHGTSLPVGGLGTHSVLAAHSGLVRAEMFTRLDQLVIGDVFHLSVLNRQLSYQVDSIEVVDPEVANELPIDPNQDYVTLTTCTPINVNTHRLLVRGHRIADLARTGSTQDLGGLKAPGFPMWLVIWLGSIAVAGAVGKWSTARNPQSQARKPEGIQ